MLIARGKLHQPPRGGIGTTFGKLACSLITWDVHARWKAWAQLAALGLVALLHSRVASARTIDMTPSS